MLQSQTRRCRWLFSFFILSPDILRGGLVKILPDSPGTQTEVRRGPFRGRSYPSHGYRTSQRGAFYCRGLLRAALGRQRGLRGVHYNDEERRLQKGQGAGLGSEQLGQAWHTALASPPGQRGPGSGRRGFGVSWWEVAPCLFLFEDGHKGLAWLPASPCAERFCRARLGPVPFSVHSSSDGWVPTRSPGLSQLLSPSPGHYIITAVDEEQMHPRRAGPEPQQSPPPTHGDHRPPRSAQNSPCKSPGHHPIQTPSPGDSGLYVPAPSIRTSKRSLHLRLV